MSDQRKYQGTRDPQSHNTIVTVDGRPLNPRLDLWKHSPTGFEWGYAGSGPAQLALAILADHLGDDFEASAMHQHFKFEIVASLDHDSWTLTSDQVQRWVDHQNDRWLEQRRRAK